MIKVITSKPHSDANSLRTSPVTLLPATKTLPPSSINCVMVSTFKVPPNSSTVGANTIRFLYRYSPYLDKTKEESSAILKVKVYPLSAKIRTN